MEQITFFVVCIFVFLPVVFPYGSVDTTGVKLVGLLDINGNNSGHSKNGISWATCKSAPCSRQITTPATHHSAFFTGRIPFLSPNQQRESTEDIGEVIKVKLQCKLSKLNT